MHMDRDTLRAAASLKDNPNFEKVLSRIAQNRDDALGRVLTVEDTVLPGARAELKAFTNLHHELSTADKALRELDKNKPLYGNTE